MKQILKYSSQEPSHSLFDNWENLMRLEEVSERYRIPKSTLYDWKYRGEQKSIWFLFILVVRPQ
jgi:hypothetical protein